jgi:hypothetical protein
MRWRPIAVRNVSVLRNLLAPAVDTEDEGIGTEDCKAVYKDCMSQEDKECMSQTVKERMTQVGKAPML